jgi:hypothetical protein
MFHPVYPKYLARQRRINSFKFWLRVTLLIGFVFFILLGFLRSIA